MFGIYLWVSFVVIWCVGAQIIQIPGMLNGKVPNHQLFLQMDVGVPKMQFTVCPDFARNIMTFDRIPSSSVTYASNEIIWFAEQPILIPVQTSKSRISITSGSTIGFTQNDTFMQLPNVLFASGVCNIIINKFST